MKDTNLILNEIRRVVKDISETKTKKLINEIIKAKKINIIGHGRSWHVGKSFAMRLRHLGLKVGVFRKDLTIVISGSGQTKDILAIVRKVPGKIICITANDHSQIAKESQLVIELKAKKSKQPLRSLFEQATLIYLDSVVIKLMRKLKITEKDMWKRHD
ncbi:MAG: SIS domain-containing protein [archaeon]